MRRLARQLAKPLALILIATQLLLAVPVSASTSNDVPCAGMSASATTHHCPCCPDGVDSMKSCLASCTLAVAVTPALFRIDVVPSEAPAFAELRTNVAPLFDPPLKPPPIA